MPIRLDTPVIELHKYGVGKLSAAMARKLAVAVSANFDKSDPSDATVEDILNYFPMRYEDRSNLVGIDKLYDGIEASVEIVTRMSSGFPVGKNRGPKQPPLFLFEIAGGDAQRQFKPVTVKWFVSGKQAGHIVHYYQEKFQPGTRFVAFGRWEWDSRRGTFSLMMKKPEELEVLPPLESDLFASSKPSVSSALDIEPDDAESEKALAEDIGSPEYATIHAGRRVPVYRKLGPFQTKRLREVIHSVLENLDPRSVAETLPADLVERQKLITHTRALNEIHFPPEVESLSDYEMARSPAHRRLIFEELFWLSFLLALQRGERLKEPKGTVIEVPRTTKERLLGIMPFELTNAQTRVIKSIFDDMQSDSPMHRLIQGDVGSGKTVVAFSAMFAAMENGYQTALMAPTEILAEQHARNARRFFGSTGYRVELLTGSTRGTAKQEIKRALAAGEVNALIGTHAVIQEDVEFERLGLAVVDEQHRFGVMQRAELQARGQNPDILVMTATPIPRSLAMTVYGDLDVSVIDELPPGRTPIKTVVVGEDKRDGVYKGIAREINLGRQAYVVYPIIEESMKVDLKAATKMYEELRDRIFPDFRVGLLHGRMKSTEKEEVMRQFVTGELNILVSTTVIEVGVDVPNASLMVIEHAERFGLSQLHQLRGRVGRGADQSFCVLLTGDKKTSVAKERLGIMEETTDGFRIAEKDLEIRGQGEILGTRQSGIQSFKIANIVRDLEILTEARHEVDHYLTEKKTSSATARLIQRAKVDMRLHLARIG
jgi:ATP-dependent DNA helicase RecG